MTERSAYPITDAQLERYARHVILDEVGEEGQARLLSSKVLVLGAGGLGAPVIQYLAAAGVGHIGVIDDDAVDLTNLQRQVIHTTDRIGMAKVDSARAFVAALNPEIRLEPIQGRLTAGNVNGLVARFDLVVDGSDNFETRYLLNDACFLAGRPLVFGALQRFEGQASTFIAHEGADRPCYRCLFPEAPPAGSVPRCEEAGIFGAVAGVIGTIQATEALKLLLGLGETLSGRLLLFDALAARFTSIRFPKNPACALCGPQATIHSVGATGGV